MSAKECLLCAQSAAQKSVYQSTLFEEKNARVRQWTGCSSTARNRLAHITSSRHSSLAELHDSFESNLARYRSISIRRTALIEFQQLLVRLSFTSRSSLVRFLYASRTLPEYENNGRSISELLSYKSIETYNL